MKNALRFACQYVDQIGGQSTTYDETKAVLVVNLDEVRFQTVLITLQTSPGSGKEQLVLTSKVCEYDPSIDLKELLEETVKFDYSKFIIQDNFIKVEASCLSSSATEEQVKEMIQEVATLADRYELKHTGQDIH